MSERRAKPEATCAGRPHAVAPDGEAGNLNVLCIEPMALFSKSDRPLLAVDIDGVISLFGFDKGAGQPPGEFHLIDGMLHCIALDTGPRLNRLAKSYELVWASGWEDRANDHLPTILGVS